MSYLAKLSNKPPHHRERFALVTSGMITLFIFAFWSLATFGDSEVVAREHEVGPLESFSASVGGSFGALKNSFLELEAISNIYGNGG